MALKVFLSSLVMVFTLYQATDAQWRSVASVELYDSTDSPYSDTEEPSGIGSLDDCNVSCVASGCKSFAYESQSQTCNLYPTRAGFDGAYLAYNYDGNWRYYDRPSGIADNDTLGDQISERVRNTEDGYRSFLPWFREGIPGQVSIDDTSTSDLEIMVEYTDIDDANSCARLCLRERGVIDEVIGTRCDSFNYNSGESTCQLLSVSWDSTHSITGFESNAVRYYDRLRGDGCWITQGNCRKYPQLEGTREIVYDESGNEITYEYQCMAQAKNYHENICDGYVTNATSVFWGGTDGQGVYDSWNSWDFTTGCVIDLSVGCYPNNNTDSRFFGKFRDSIAEEQFNAGNSVDSCFDRAQTWNEYCGLDDSQTISIEFPSTGAVYIYPLINCTCNGYGKKTDISTELDFCTRNDSDPCWRPYQQDFWSFLDILCSDLSGGCPEYIGAEWPSNSTKCYLSGPLTSGFLCDNGDYGDFFEVGCPESLQTEDGECDYDSFNETHCENAAELYHEACGNDIDTSEEQAVTFYIPTGGMFVYPNWEEPQENSLIKGLQVLLGYTKSDTSDYGSVAIGTGRWMSVYNGAAVQRTLRQIDIWFEHTKTVSLTMSFYKGEGVTGSVKLETISIGEFGPTANGGEYIHFDIDNIVVEPASWYTWQVTSTNGDNDIGYIGFGIDYSNGVGDLTWDYAFVMWIENFVDAAGTMELYTKVSKPDDPWFEPLFIIGLILLGLWIIFLIIFNINRKRQEEKEKEEERQRQQEIKKRARQKAMARNVADDEFFDEDGDPDREHDLLDSDEEEDDSDDDDNWNGNLASSTPNKNAIVEEEDDDDDDVVTTKGRK